MSKHPEIGVIAFVPDVWGGIWQPRHQIISRLSMYYQVLWFDPPRNWRNCLNKRQQDRTFTVPLGSTFPDFTVYRHSRFLPQLYKPEYAAKLLDKGRVQAGIRYLTSRGCKHFCAYIWRPHFESSLWSAPFDFRCYHIDDEYSFSTDDKPVSDLEKSILNKVDHTFIHSPGLIEKKAKFCKHYSYTPNGVDFDAFSAQHKAPEDLADIPGPIIGYIGVLKSFLDWDLIRNIIQARNDLSFVFVGPEGTLNEHDSEIISTLKNLNNVHFLGTKNVDDLPAYACNFDICTMPYRVNGYTNYIFPLKVNEYLAAGKPTIGTRIRTLIEYESHITLASSTSEWLTAIDKHLANLNKNELTEARQDLAREYDWDNIVQAIADVILEGVKNKVREPISI